MNRRALILAAALGIYPALGSAQAVGAYCAIPRADSGPFQGSTITRVSGTDTVIVSHIGFRGSERYMMQAFDDLRICIATDGFAGDSAALPGSWPALSRRVLLQSTVPGDARLMDITRERTALMVNSQTRVVDDEARQWQAGVIDVLEPLWESTILRSQITYIETSIERIGEERMSLDTAIAGIEAGVRTLHLEIETLRARERSYRATLASMNRRTTELQARLTQERRSVAAAQSSGSGSASRVQALEASVRRLEQELARHERQVFDLERQTESLDVERRVNEIEWKLQGLDGGSRMAALKIQVSDADGRVAALRTDISRLEGEIASRSPDARTEAAVKRLRALLVARDRP